MQANTEREREIHALAKKKREIHAGMLNIWGDRPFNIVQCIAPNFWTTPPLAQKFVGGVGSLRQSPLH